MTLNYGDFKRCFEALPETDETTRRKLYDIMRFMMVNDCFEAEIKLVHETYTEKEVEALKEKTKKLENLVEGKS